MIHSSACQQQADTHPALWDEPWPSKLHHSLGHDPRFSLTLPTVKKILEKYQIYHRLRRGRPLPDGISLLTAAVIEQAIGIWPSSRNLDEIENREVDLIKSCTTRIKDLRIALDEINAAKSLLN